jgi:hypothetical protein
MPKPKCPKCEGGMFEAVELQPLKSKATLHAICCVNCGTAIGVHDVTLLKLAQDLMQRFKQKFGTIFDR